METVREYPTQVTSVGAHKDALVLIVCASREVGGEFVPLVDAQIDAALAGARAALQCVGAEVEGVSTAFLIPSVELGEEETLTLQTSAVLVKGTRGAES